MLPEGRCYQKDLILPGGRCDQKDFIPPEGLDATRRTSYYQKDFILPEGRCPGGVGAKQELAFLCAPGRGVTRSMMRPIPVLFFAGLSWCVEPPFSFRAEPMFIGGWRGLAPPPPFHGTASAAAAGALCTPPRFMVPSQPRRLRRSVHPPVPGRISRGGGGDLRNPPRPFSWCRLESSPEGGGSRGAPAA